MLDPLGHHAVTCKFGRDVVSRHNQLRDTFEQTCRLTGVSASIEAGSELGHEHLHTRPADVLPNWVCSKLAALGFTVVPPLGSTHIIEAGTTAGSAALERKHANNDQKYTELNWVCVPMAVEVYGTWGEEAQHTYVFSIGHQTVFSTQTRSTVKHICEAEHDAGQSQCKGLAKQSYSRLIVAQYMYVQYSLTFCLLLYSK